MGEVTLTAYGDVPESYEAWADTVVAIGTRGSAVPWHLGDLLLAGEQRFSEQYAAVTAQLETLGYKPATLQALLFVARQVPQERRRAAVDWSQHRELAGLTAEQQTEWLERCERDELSVKALRDALTEAGLRKSRGGTKAKTCPGCDAYAEQVESMQETIDNLHAQLNDADRAIRGLDSAARA